MSSSSAYHSARSSVSSSPTLVTASLPVNSLQTLVDEPTIVVDDSDDDGKSNDGLDRSDDDEVDDLANRLGLTTLYTVNETQTTPYW